MKEVEIAGNFGDFIMNPMQSPNTGVGKQLISTSAEHGILTKVWEAYKEDSQNAVIARTKSLAKKYAFQIFGGFDLIGEAEVLLSPDEVETIKNDGAIYS